MTRWAGFVVARKWWVLGLVVLVAVLAGIWGSGVFGKMSQGGFIDPGSESAEVARITEDTLGPQTPDIIALYTPENGETLDDIGPRVTATLDEFAGNVSTHSVSSYWSGPPQVAQSLRSEDGTTAAAAIILDHDSGVTMGNFNDLLPQLEVDGVDVQFAGNSVVGVAFTQHLQNDLIKAEAIALPITLVLLFFIFGGLVAAAVPVFVGAMAVFCALAILRLLTLVTDVSSFAVNVASLLGLGLAIDYGLFVVGRFREELANGATPAEATTRTVLTAGRTIAFSGLLLVCAFAGMLVFPQGVIKSLGFGAMAAVASAAVLSLTLVPALLAILGTRINSLTWRKGAADRGEARARRFWTAVVTKVMRRPATIAVLIVGALLLMASPLLKASFGEVTYTALPEDDPARVATDILTQDFPTTGNGATLILRSTDDTPPSLEDASAVARQAGEVPGIGQASVLGSRGDLVAISAVYAQGVETAAQSDAVRDLRAISPPAGTELLVGGGQATVDDGNAAITAWLPVMIAIMVVSTLLLLFLAFGSVVLPIKAVAMAGLSLAATFGALTWIFQLGHGAELLGITPAPLEPTFVVLILAVVFGLSTDYEVFLMSRMVEARAAGASTEEAVTFGAARTGRIVTAAALLLIVVTGAFTISGLSIMRFLGVGMIIALIVDATVVRMLLVPSLVKLMGEANWWAPRWMKRVHEKVGIGH
ncbi:MMPL family transporter [Rhodococcus triatomae]|uniref:Putative drug exporter of the RND superfamily n=1 Tax=Rhodococcus triatomae TaxID=300028 RepID=A0A1G8FPC6_9NOCA|nr:MMPL family transporter [Rhodococcus triatomae]QNG19539.1 MMPL family transporter [Rhodococcus triatomae]QNG24546.1 MMPL family transporter [Rhodococcus triatomae]SDH84033.1 putative drug exporter of the RND superfamily [Rhodococcus triatomae]